MTDAFEQLVLSGALFDPSRSPPRSQTPTSRPPSPTTTDELFGPSPSSSRAPSPTSRVGRPSKSERRAAEEASRPADAPEEPLSSGPGRTGVKGVIRDRNEARDRDRARREKEMVELRAKMEKSSLAYGAKTFLEEQAERDAEKRRENGEESDAKGGSNEKARWKDERMGSMGMGRFPQGPFGYLREVGFAGYLEAIEKEARDVWVVVHIYHPGVVRCSTLDASLISLARANPFTKFLRVRASAIGFATASRDPYASSNLLGPSRTSSHHHRDDEDDWDDEDDAVDEDMLPTMLVYRGGDLVYNWVRVDLEAGAAGIGELLQKNKIIVSAAKTSRRDEDEDDDYE